MPRKAPCGNPLFLEWAEAIQQEAEIKEWKAANTYRKACNSIRSCPIPFTTPQDLITLSNVGPMMVKMLEQRQKEHYLNLGLPLPNKQAIEAVEVGSPDEMEFVPRPDGTESVAPAKVPRARKRKEAAEEEGDQEIDGNVSPVKKKTKTKTKPAQPKAPKVYVPKTRSGSYAILLALLLNVTEEYRKPLDTPPDLDSPTDIAEFEDAQGDRLNIELQNAQLTKQDTIALAKPHCDSDFGKSETGGHYTAWSSMKTLLGRGLVCTRGNPARFWLTREGWTSALAIKEAMPAIAKESMASKVRMQASDVTAVSNRSLPQARPIVACRGTSSGSLRVENTSVASNPSAKTLPARSSTLVGSARSTPYNGPTTGNGSVNPLIFSYLGEGDVPVARLADAQRSEDAELFLPIRRVRVKVENLTHPQASRLRNLVQARDMSSGIQFDGWILEANAPELCAAFRTAVEVHHDQQEPRISTRNDEDTDVQYVTIDHPDVEVPPASSSVYGDDGFEALMSTFVAQTESPLGVVHHPTPIEDGACKDHLPAPVPPGVFPMDLSPVRPPRPTVPPSGTMAKTMSSVSVTATVREAADDSTTRETGRAGDTMETTHRDDWRSFSSSNAIRYAAEDYEIVLVMDTREIKNRRDEEAICKGLRDHGVHVDVRALKLGDITWVARLKPGKQPRLAGDERECMLDYVVERKRLDDLCSSIRDGRYDDQKYRLTNSSIGHVYYVVENWDIERKPDSSLSLQIATAKSQTQIVSGFFLKETHKLSETIDFLRVLTENIVDTLKGQDIYMIPGRYISRTSYVQLQSRLKTLYPDRPFLISYETYQAINGKNANQTTGDVWAKMLLCVKGMSAEKVGAIIKRYPTAVAFWKGYTKRKLEWEREKLENPTKKIRDLELFFADSVQGDGRQKIGDALSRELFSVFCA